MLQVHDDTEALMNDRELLQHLIITNQLRMAAAPLNRHMRKGQMFYYPSFWPREALRRFFDMRKRRKLMPLWPEHYHLAFYEGTYIHEKTPAK
jgi:hypothetical protein